MPDVHPSTDRGPRSQRSLFLCLAILVVVANLAACVACLEIHRRTADDRILAPTAMIFLICAVVQAWFMYGNGRAKHLAGLAIEVQALCIQPRFWRRLVLGTFMAYVAVLAVGPLPQAVWPWAAAVSTWYTLLLLPLAAEPQIVDRWRRWSQLRGTRRLSWLVYVASMLLVVSESSLQAYRLAERQAWPGGVEPEILVEMQQIAADSQAARDPRKPFRIAVVADPATLGADGQAWLAGIEQTLPGVEIKPIALERGWWSETAGDLWRQLSEAEPDLVLAAIAACEDLTHEAPSPNWFDWRQLELARMAGVQVSPQELPTGDLRADDFEIFLARMVPRAVACRTPADDRLQVRWQRAFSSLDRLLHGCRNRRVPAAIVLVPSHFQVNTALCPTIARRMGLSPEQLDVELPQRRLTSFANQRHVPTLDLLPHLRLRREPLYERNTLVWNEEGSSTAAATIGAWLETSYGMQPEVAARLSRAQ